MKVINIILILILSNPIIAQIDAIKIGSAKKAFENSEFQTAINTLNEVTSNGKKSKLFLFYKGYSHYKLNQFDSAEFFLKKYLLIDSENNEVIEALVDIDYEKAKKKKLAEIRSGLKFYKLKGKVKSVEVKSVCDNETTSIHKIQFDEFGNIISDKLELYNPYTAYNYTYKINADGFISELISQGSHYYYYYDKNGRESSMKTSGGYAMTNDNYVFDSNNNLIEYTKTCDGENWTKYEKRTILKTYNSLGDLLTDDSSSYSNYVYDSLNWIQRTELHSYMAGKSVYAYRKIEYYDK